MTEQETIKLRGHHLSNLAYSYWESKGLFFEQESDKQKHLHIYGPDFTRKFRKFRKSLLSSPEMLVEIVSGFDSVCELECPLRNANMIECYIQDAKHEDVKTLEEYDLKPGDKKTMSEIIQIIEQYHTKTGYLTPRNKILEKG